MPIVLLSLLPAAVVLSAGGTPTFESSEPWPPTAVQSGKAAEMDARSLAGTEWLLRSLRGMDVDLEIGSSLSFDEEGNVSGNGGCNRFRGAAVIKGQTLKFGDLASTMMACEDAKTRQERDYHAAMAETVAFRIEQRELSLLNEEDEVVALLIAADQN